MKALIEKLEQATEGSRELDLDIELHLRGDEWEPHQGYPFGTVVPKKGGGIYRVPFYTTSLDAALTLVPGRVGKIETTVYRLVAEKTIVNLFDTQNVACGAGRSKNPALALCIAALKARE